MIKKVGGKNGVT